MAKHTPCGAGAVRCNSGPTFRNLVRSGNVVPRRSLITYDVAKGCEDPAAKNETIFERQCGFLAGRPGERPRPASHREHGDYRSSTTAERAARAASGPKFRRKSSTRYEGMEADELLHLIDNLEDERSRARVREGIYISLLAHVLIFLWILFGPRYILHRPKVVSPFDVLTERQKKEMTYLSLPPDALKHIQPKNPQGALRQEPRCRVAASDAGQEDAGAVAGDAACRAAGFRTRAAAADDAAADCAAARSSRNPHRPKAAPAQPLQPQLEGVTPAPPPEPKPQPTKPNFNTGMSAGDQIRQAARGAAQPQDAERRLWREPHAAASRAQWQRGDPERHHGRGLWPLHAARDRGDVSLVDTADSGVGAAAAG